MNVKEVLNLSCFLFIVVSQQANVASGYDCYACLYSDMDVEGDTQYCAPPTDDETTVWTTCPVGCYALDAVFKYENEAGVENVTRFVLRGCADPNFPVGGCLRGQQLLRHYTAYIQPYLGPEAKGIESGSLCSCAKDICNSGVAWQPTVFKMSLIALCGFIMASVLRDIQ